MLAIHQVVNSVFSSNTYVITGFRREVFLVDIGDYDKVKELLGDNDVIKAVFLTHTHYDHIYGLPALLSDYPACSVYTSASGVKALASSRYNFSRYYNDIIEIQGENVVALSQGVRIGLAGKIEMTVWETPGHDGSCLAYRVGNAFFSGDSYIPGLKVLASFPLSNKIKAEESMKRIIELAEGLDLYPGHGKVFYGFSASDYTDAAMSVWVK